MTRRYSADDLQDMAEALVKWPANGKARDVAMLQVLREAGLVEEQHTNKRCKACGTESPDYYWWKITPAGYLFIEAMGMGDD